MDIMRTIIQTELLFHTKDITDAVQIECLEQKYENIQNYIENMTLAELQQENFGFPIDKFKTMLKLLKYFVMDNSQVKQSISFGNWHNWTVTSNQLDHLRCTKYIMYFLRQHISVPINSICVNDMNYYRARGCIDEFITDLIFVIENAAIKRFKFYDEKSFSASDINKIIRSLPKATITHVIAKANVDHDLVADMSNFLKDNDQVRVLNLYNVNLLSLNCAALQKLTLKCTIGFELANSIIHLINVGCLTKLDLRDCQFVHEEYVQRLGCALETNVSLRSLDLSNINATNIACVITFLTHNKFLEHVNLSANLICYQNAHELLSCMLNNDNIKSLLITYPDELYDRAKDAKLVELLCQVLRTNVRLETLHASVLKSYLHGQNVNDIMEALDNNYAITNLNLQYDHNRMTQIVCGNKATEVLRMIDYITDRNTSIKFSVSETKSARSV